jgi:peptide/nickel transport system substrate-binding protein
MPPKRSRVPARRPRFLTPIFLSLLTLVACTYGGGSEPSDARLTHVGGTLELSMVGGDFRSQYPGDPAVNLDPARDHSRTGMELLRCCLARTLLMPDDRPGHAGRLVPDLAATMPIVSADGLTWTFRLRSGLTYAPPLDHTPIVAADLKRSLTRVALLGDAAAYAYEFSPIEGFDAVVQGIASSITGLDLPDERTLQIHLTEPTADLGYRLALPAAAPLPPSSKEMATMGIATGHDRDYGEFLVSSGPYMYQGADIPTSSGGQLIDLEDPAGITLVRNPSWDPASDPIRGAYPNQIDISTTAERPSENAALVGEGGLDFQFEERSTTAQADFDAPTNGPEAATRSFQWPLDDTWVIAMNAAVPPFDDLFIRRAVGLAFDTTAALAAIHAGDDAATGWYSTGIAVTHIAPNDLEGGRLVNFDPFLGKQGPDRRARADIAIGKSSYEHQKDGDCIDPLCRGITIAVYDQPPFPDIADSLRRDLSAVGIKLQDTNLPYEDAYDPASHVGIVIGPPWSTDYPNASRSFVPMTGAMIAAVGNHNFSLTGGSSTQLSDFGYQAVDMPTIDGRFGFCAPLTSEEQVSCWTLLDKYTMTEVVPWVPYLSTTIVWTASSRVHSIVQDPFSKMVALDQVWLSDVTPSSI